MTDSHETRFVLLWDAHFEDVLGYARRRATISVADDVAAETFAVAWRRLADVPADARPWLLGVARKVLANRRRGQRRAGALAARLGLERAVCAPDPADLVGADHALRDGFAALGARDREILALVAWEGLRPAEIAEVLGVSVAMVSARLFRARSRLRRALDAGPAPVAHAPKEG